MTIWLIHTCHNYTSSCSYLLVYMTAHPKFFKLQQKNNFNHFFNICHVFLTFFLPWIFLLYFLFIFPSCFTFPLATTHKSIVSGLYNHSMCNFNMFLCSDYPKLKRNWQTILTLSGFHAIWLLANQISLRHALTHFARCSLVTISFQVFYNPLSGNVIGLHATWIFIIPRFLIIDSRNKQSCIASFCQNHS